MSSNAAFRMIVTCLLTLAVSACGGGGGGGGGGDNGGGGNGIPDTPPTTDIGGNTSGYTGRLAWSAVSGFASRHLRVWDMAGSKFVLRQDAPKDATYNFNYPALSASGEAVTYTFQEGLALLPGSPQKAAQVRIHDLQSDTAHTVPTEDGNGNLRDARYSSITADGLTVVFIDSIHEPSPQGEGILGTLVSQGVATWNIGDAQPQRVAEGLSDLHCPRISGNGMRIVVYSDGDLYRIDNGALPERIDLIDPQIEEVVGYPDTTLRCGIALSDDGSKIAYRAKRTGAEGDQLHVTDLAADQTHWLGQWLEGELRAWSLSGDGRFVAAATEEIIDEDENESISRLYLLDLADLGNPGLIWENYSEDGPGWSASAPAVALSRTGDAIALIDFDLEILRPVVRVMRADGSEPRSIKDDPVSISLSLTF